MNAKHFACVLVVVALSTSAQDPTAPSAKSATGAAQAASGCTTSSATVASGLFLNGLTNTNGNKAVVGRDHRIHLVYRDSGQNNIDYRSSADGVIWSAPVALSSAGGGNPIVQDPAIAVDSGGTLGVVFVVQSTSDIYYTYRSYGATAFSTPVKLAVGQQPSMAGAGGRMYLAWSHGFGVSYTDFPSTAPPPNVGLGHVLIQTTICSTNTTFSWPSIAVMVPRCGGAPVVKVATLYFSDERQNPYGCPQPIVENGVYVLNACPLCFGSFAYVNTIAVSNPPSGTAIEGVSVSLDADSSRFYLAWSDVFGTARTMLASGTGSLNWPAPTVIATKRSTVDVAVEPGGSEFRVAWNEMSGLSAPAFHRNGVWQAGSTAPTWSSPAQAVAATGYSANPQAFFWKRCKGGTLSTVPVIYENGMMSSSIRSDVVSCPANCAIGWLSGPVSDC